MVAIAKWLTAQEDKTCTTAQHSTAQDSRQDRPADKPAQPSPAPNPASFVRLTTGSYSLFLFLPPTAQPTAACPRKRQRRKKTLGTLRAHRRCTTRPPNPRPPPPIGHAGALSIVLLPYTLRAAAVCFCARIFLHVYIRTCMHACMHTHTCIHTPTHTHTVSDSCAVGLQGRCQRGSNMWDHCQRARGSNASAPRVSC